MTDTTLTDMAPFFDRYDHRQRLVFVAALSASLVLAAVIATHGVLTGAVGPRPVAAVWGLGVLFPPLFVVAWWSVAEHMARSRRRSSQPDGRHPASADDARNGMRIANAGFVFNVVVTATVIGTQAIMALLAFGYPTGDVVPRATTVAVCVVTIYLGNLWPRMPTARGADRQSANGMKANRAGGWLMVVFGLLAVLVGLFMPFLHSYAPALHAHG